MDGQTMLIALMSGLLIVGVSKTVQAVKVVAHKAKCAVVHGASHCVKEKKK
jgi:ribosomal protein L30E